MPTRSKEWGGEGIVLITTGPRPKKKTTSWMMKIKYETTVLPGSIELESSSITDNQVSGGVGGCGLIYARIR